MAAEQRNTIKIYEINFYCISFKGPAGAGVGLTFALMARRVRPGGASEAPRMPHQGGHIGPPLRRMNNPSARNPPYMATAAGSC